MWKLVIADDEPKIRRGIKNVLNWSEFGIEIVGQAEDGEIALEIIKEQNRYYIIGYKYAILKRFRPIAKAKRDWQ